jgi:paraquat-inducible protein A
MQRVPPLPPRTAAECPRCGNYLGLRSGGNLQLTAALALAALILYVPANLYPIMSMSLHGAYSENTVWEGVLSLAEAHEWFVAVVVFLASIVIPLLKLLGLFLLAISARWKNGRRTRTRLHRFIEALGPWAMLDVFLLAVLVALVKLNSLATVLPGPGLAAFTAVVVLTIFASASFDPKLIWERG